MTLETYLQENHHKLSSYQKDDEGKRLFALYTESFGPIAEELIIQITEIYIKDSDFFLEKKLSAVFF